MINEKISRHIGKQNQYINAENYFRYYQADHFLPESLKKSDKAKPYISLALREKSQSSTIQYNFPDEIINSKPYLATQQIDQDSNVTEEVLSFRRRKSVPPERQRTQFTDNLGGGKHSTEITVIPSDQVDYYSRKFKLTWKQIYQLHSEFCSLVQIQLDVLREKIKEKQSRIYQVDLATTKRRKAQIIDLCKTLQTIEALNQIGLASFIEFAQVAKDKFDDITRRIICAFGLDFSDERRSNIDFDTYCRIKCFLNYHTLEQHELRRIWIKILNPQSNIVVARNVMLDLFERFARGCMQENPTLISTTFAEKMLQLFQMEGCLPMEDRVDMKILSKLIAEGTFDVALFHQMILSDCKFEVYSENYSIN